MTAVLWKAMVEDTHVSVPEAARRIGVHTEDAYKLIFEGSLDGRPDHDGIVRVSDRAIAEYLERETRV
jgi:hypothetical protein